MTDSRKPIVVVGSINMDLVTRCRQIPVPGQTVTGTGFETTPGGKGANQAVAAARLGYPTAIIGAVGEDVFSQSLLNNLSQASVSTQAVTRVPGPSGVAAILLAANAQNSIVIVAGANGRVDRAAIDNHAELIRSAGMVLCQLEIPMDTLSYTLDFCARANVPVMLDPAPAAALPEAAWKQVAWFTPNETEAAFYVGDAVSVEDTAKRLLAKGLPGVVLKRGGDGAFVTVAEGKGEWVKPFKVNAIDTVGAGDCFNGAFAVALSEGKSPWAAARFASAASAISVTRKGAQASMPSRAEVDVFLEENE
jgi:ribokinase